MLAVKFSSPAELAAELKQGRMIVLGDEITRENEGDLVMAAEKVTPAAINFMASYARGLICLALTPAKCDELQLPLMVANNDSPHKTNFTVSIDAKSGISTGISAADRAITIQTAAAPNAAATELVRPGHIFPLRAHPQGLKGRRGHTEAAIELSSLAGLIKAAVIVEIMNPDGSMARLPDLEKFSYEHGLSLGKVEDLL